jgi:hypothetical protein
MIRKDWATAKTTGTARVELDERAINWLGVALPVDGGFTAH